MGRLRSETFPSKPRAPQMLWLIQREKVFRYYVGVDLGEEDLFVQGKSLVPGRVISRAPRFPTGSLPVIADL